MRWRNERAAVTVQAAWVATLLMLVTVFSLQVAHLIHLRHRVASAADLAALAASQASVQGKDGCQAARSIARRNGVDLVACRMDYDVATVTARAISVPWWGSRWGAQQRARAAPEYYLSP